jgi:CcmD family protein
LTLKEALPYVAGAYMAVWLVILLYVGILGRKLTRLEATLEKLESAAPSDPSTK